MAGAGARRAAGRHRRHGAQPRRGGRSGAPSCRRSACRASCSTRERWTSSSTELAALTAGRARAGAGHQARARRPDPGGRRRASRRCSRPAASTALEVTEAGLREGVFFARQLATGDPPLVADVRRASVRNLAAPVPRRLAARRARRARSRCRCSTCWPRPGCMPATPAERELLWAAALLHDIGMAVDYDDHHKHSRYLILNAGLPGFTPREVALIAQMARYHRKGTPALGRPRAADAQGRRASCWTAARRCCGWPSSSSAPRPGRARRRDVDGRRRPRRASSCGPTATSRVARWAAERQRDAVRARVRARRWRSPRPAARRSGQRAGRKRVARRRSPAMATASSGRPCQSAPASAAGSAAMTASGASAPPPLHREAVAVDAGAKAVLAQAQLVGAVGGCGAARREQGLEGDHERIGADGGVVAGR